MSDTHDPLAVPAIAAALGALAVRFDVDVLADCESTNSELMRRAEAGAPSGTVVAAERQTAGRGRMGRSWFAEPGASLTFSLLWRFAPGTWPHGLSLAVGVALAEALEKTGVTKLALKWPNDLLLDGRKLAGTLVELVPGSPHAAVIGIGLNLRLPRDMPEDVRALAAALDREVPRNELLARLLESLHGVLTAFADGGFVALRQRWLAHCTHIDAPVQILSEFAPPLAGHCIGVDVDGALLVETAVCVQRILSGEVSLRRA
ncbi:MAG: biotin--[acetyl-CoA-carboxylase] ligase [Rhodocyclaceae bacterium]|nr:biotin--[acetyl-CoA-carboxylase] ligase [Rhodocyclaceae bacterium]